jgi:hypothetical protein
MPRRWRTVLNPENLTPNRLTLKADPQQTDVQIGLAVGLSDKTVASVRVELVARSEISSDGATVCQRDSPHTLSEGEERTTTRVHLPQLLLSGAVACEASVLSRSPP